ncbi:MAG: phosphatase PAP2 family protein [Acidimicrobiia bacterium]
MSGAFTEDNPSARPTGTGGGRWPLDRTSLFEVAGLYVLLSALGVAMGWLVTSWSESSPDIGFDETTVTWWQAQRSTTLDTLTDVGSSFADTAILSTVVAALLLGLIFVWRLRRSAVALGLALGFEVVVFLTVSAVIGRARPDVEQLDPAPPTASFPSGHVGATVAFALIVTVIVFWNTRNASWRALAVTSAIAISVIMALSRMYRGMHFFTDVVGGALLGAAAAVAAWLVINRALERRRRNEAPV